MPPAFYRCTAALFLVAILPACLPGLPTFPNIKYLGLGYDIVKANPQPLVTDPTPFDPGWKAKSIFDMTTFKNNYTYGNKWAQPDSADILQTGACEYAAQRSEVGSTSAYQKSLSVDISFSGSYSEWLFKARFSASVDYQSTKTGTQSEQQFYFSSAAKCEMYRASLVAYETLPLWHEFRDGVGSLPTELNSSTVDAVTTFVGYFGTHYTTEIKMGGKATYTAVFDKASYSKMEAGGVDVNAAASLSFAAWTGSTSVQTDSHYKDYQAYQSSKSNFVHSCVGANGQCPPTSPKQDPNVWADQVSEAPVPIEYTLASIDTVLTQQYFPSDPNIQARQRVLNEFLTGGSAGGLGYCGRVANCDPPEPAGYWVSAADMSGGPNTQFAMAALDYKLYAAGGCGGQACIQYVPPVSSVTSYDSSSNTWATVASMQVERRLFAMATLGGKLYAAGGYSTGNPVIIDTVESYDPSSNSWTYVASMQVARVDFAMAALGGKLYAAGGSQQGLSSVESYDPSSNSWAYVASMQVARADFAMAALGGKLYAAGGLKNDSSSQPGLSSVESYDPSSNSWAYVASMHVARTGFAMAAFEGKLYAAGGILNESSPFLSSVEAYEPSSNSWATVVSMQVGRWWFGLAALEWNGQHKLYAAGGWSVGGGSVERFWNASAIAPQLDGSLMPILI